MDRDIRCTEEKNSYWTEETLTITACLCLVPGNKEEAGFGGKFSGIVRDRGRDSKKYCFSQKVRSDRIRGEWKSAGGEVKTRNVMHKLGWCKARKPEPDTS
jgi:hypothetical protein